MILHSVGLHIPAVPESKWETGQAAVQMRAYAKRLMKTLCRSHVSHIWTIELTYSCIDSVVCCSSVRFESGAKVLHLRTQ